MKNTDCPFSLVIKLVEYGFSCINNMEWNHNHATQAGQSYCFEAIPNEMIDRIYTTFNHKYTTGSAYKELIKLLKKECNTEIEFHEKLSHRSKMPLRRDFDQLYPSIKLTNMVRKTCVACFLYCT